MERIVKKSEMHCIRFSMIDSYFSKSVISLPYNLKFDEDYFNYRLQNIIADRFMFIVNNGFYEEDRNEILNYEYLFSLSALYFDFDPNPDFEFEILPIIANKDIARKHPINLFIGLLTENVDQALKQLLGEVFYKSPFHKYVEVTSILKPKSKLQTSSAYGELLD